VKRALAFPPGMGRMFLSQHHAASPGFSRILEITQDDWSDVIFKVNLPLSLIPFSGQFVPQMIKRGHGKVSTSHRLELHGTAPGTKVHMRKSRQPSTNPPGGKKTQDHGC